MQQLPAWMVDQHGQPVWWYDPHNPSSPIMQGLHWACSGSLEQCAVRKRFWHTPRLEAAFDSQDGYVPGVRWNPQDDPARPSVHHPLSVHRFLSALRTAYDTGDRETLEHLARLIREPQKGAAA